MLSVGRLHEILVSTLGWYITACSLPGVLVEAEADDLFVNLPPVAFGVAAIVFPRWVSELLYPYSRDRPALENPRSLHASLISVVGLLIVARFMSSLPRLYYFLSDDWREFHSYPREWMSFQVAPSASFVLGVILLLVARRWSGKLWCTGFLDRTKRDH